VAIPHANVTTAPPGEASRRLALLSIVTSGAFVALLATLHVVKSDVDPSWHFISEYELGAWGWLMQAAFLLLATSCATLALSLASQIRTVFGWIGILSLGASAVGMVIAGIFVTEAPNAARVALTEHGRLHELGASLDGLPLAALWINWSLARNVNWAAARRTLLVTAPLPLLGLVAFFAALATQVPPPGTMMGPANHVGWPNRIMILAHCAWIIPVAMELRRRR
jgi:hypothetical protein